MTEPDGPIMGTMSFRDHLAELRSRLLRATVGVVLGFFLAWAFHVELFTFLSAPVREALALHGLFAIKALAITESVEVYMKLSLVGGLFLASPYVFYQIWAFVAPGLLDRERRLLVPVVSGSVACFLLGAAFCYLIVLPFMTDFLIGMTMEPVGVTLEPTLATTMSFSLLMLVAFGAVFELPLFMYVLAAMGLVTAQGFWNFYRYWIVVAFILGAVLTPTPDPINQSLMSMPLVVLYGVGVGIAWLVQREPGFKVPRRMIAIVAGVLVTLAAGGVALALKERDRDGLDDVPADVVQLIGLHVASLVAVGQQAEGSLEAGLALGPFALIDALHLKPLRNPVALLARFDDGVALVVEVADAEAVVRRLAKVRQASVVTSPSGPSTWFALDDRGRRGRAVAAGRRTLWLGDDAALLRLAEVRRGRTPGLVRDPAQAERVQALRSSGPLWSLAPTEAGVAGWLPGGALGQNVRAAGAVLAREQGRLVLRYDCRGVGAAAALRDRIDAWVADTRRTAGPPTQDRDLLVLVGRLRELALLVGRTADTTALGLPSGSREQVTLQTASSEAVQLARDLSEWRTPDTVIDSRALALLVQAPAVSTAEVRATTVFWTIQAEVPVLLAALAAPASSGLTADLARAVAKANVPAAVPAAVQPADPAGVPQADPAQQVPVGAAPQIPAERAPQAAVEAPVPDRQPAAVEERR